MWNCVYHFRHPPAVYQIFLAIIDSHLQLFEFEPFLLRLTRTLLVEWVSLAWRLILLSAGAGMPLFRLEYKTSVVCHNANNQNLKFARIDSPNILATHWWEAFENLHTDIAPVRRTLSWIFNTLEKLSDDFYQNKYYIASI